jgi:hypothetical protein
MLSAICLPKKLKNALKTSGLFTVAVFVNHITRAFIKLAQPLLDIPTWTINHRNSIRGQHCAKLQKTHPDRGCGGFTFGCANGDGANHVESKRRHP